MAELRLIPPAALLWVVTLIIIGTRTPWWALALVFVVGVGVVFWDVGLALTTTVILSLDHKSRRQQRIV